MIDKRILAGIFVLSTILVCIFPFAEKRRALRQVPEQRIEQTIQEPVEPPKPREATREEAKASIRKEDIKSLVGYLCAFNGRKSGTAENVEASHFIQDQFKNFGVNEQLDGFRLGNSQTQNVYGWIDGADPSTCFVIGGHFDHLGPGYPGADDNASGTSGVIMLARAFSMLKGSLPKTLVFQCYSGEEAGLYGSKFYVKYPKFPKNEPNLKSHLLMINLDMIGHLNNREPKSMFNFGATGGASDHISFYNAGVPAYFVFTGMHGRYHKPTDTPNSLDYDGMEKLLKYVYDVIWYNLDKKEKPCSFEPPVKPVSFNLDHDFSPFLTLAP